MLEREYFIGNATGDIKINTKLYIEKFDKYIIKLVLDEDNKFVRIDEIAIDKNFLESRHKKSSLCDFSEYYLD